MGWYSIDAIGIAIKRTKKALIEPFNFWKWIKLGIIVLFVGGGGAGFPNLNFLDGFQGFEDTKTEGPSTQEILNQIGQFWHQYKTYILIAIAVIVLIILLLILVSSVMEFVFVESLVINSVSIRAYFRKYLRLGFNLFVINVLLVITFFSLFVLAMMPIVQSLLEPSVPTPGMVFGAILWFFAVLIILAIVSGIISSFIDLSIPVAMYQGTGIIEAIKTVLGKFRVDWKQILVYWVIRVILGIVVGIIVGIAALLLLIIILLIILLPGAVLYLLLSGTSIGTSNPLFWVVIVPYGLIALIILVLFILIASVPAPVFMKYHMLTFLQRWYADVKLPFFDEEKESAGAQT